MLVRQAAHVLELLEYFATVKKPASLAEISAAMGWPRSSTFNLLTTLAKRGFLYEPRPRGGYYPSPRWLALIQTIAEPEHLPDELCKAVDEIARTTGETVAVAAPSVTNAVFLYVVESVAAIRFSASVGHQVPIHATACGRALLSQYSPLERASVLKKVQYVRFSNRSLMNAEQVEAEIKRSEARGWHENIEGHAADLNGVAAPVGLGDRRLAVVVGGPATRMRNRVPQIAATLKRELKRHLAPIEATGTRRSARP
jgi:IclR family transcriptional regulator, acetate operon repressor